MKDKTIKTLLTGGVVAVNNAGEIMIDFDPEGD